MGCYCQRCDTHAQPYDTGTPCTWLGLQSRQGLHRVEFQLAGAAHSYDVNMGRVASVHWMASSGSVVA